MDDVSGFDLLGADVAFGPMTEAESKAADAAKAKAKPSVMTFEPENIWLKPSMTEAESKAADAAKAKAKPSVMTFEPENIWLKPSTWFKEPAWEGGPPRWQLALAGSVAGLGLGALLFGAVKK